MIAVDKDFLATVVLHTSHSVQCAYAAHIHDAIKFAGIHTVRGRKLRAAAQQTAPACDCHVATLKSLID